MMDSDQPRDRLGNLAWLVGARNDIQSLMLRLLQRWDEIERWRRADAVSAAFSLWRAVFLLVDRDEEKMEQNVDGTALGILTKVVRTNTIAFTDDVNQREWSSYYYVENALFRISRLADDMPLLGPFHGSPSSSVRESWEGAYRLLDAFVAGTHSGTPGRHQEKGSDAQSA